MRLPSPGYSSPRSRPTKTGHCGLPALSPPLAYLSRENTFSREDYLCPSVCSYEDNARRCFPRCTTCTSTENVFLFLFRFQRTASRLRLSATWGSTSLTESPERPSRRSSYWPSRRSSERGSTWVSPRGPSSRRRYTLRRHR